MKAIVQSRYGQPDAVLRLREVRTPVAGDGEVLVRVRAASVHPDVWHVVRGWPYVLRVMGAGLRRPKRRIPGTDMAGVVEAVGRGVTRFQPGDAVFGETGRGHQWMNGGAFAEYVAVPAGKLARKPSNLTFEQAAAVPTSALLAFQAVHDQAGVQPGQRVLVNGAGGGVGTFAVQLARAYGAEVTAVDRAEKLEMLRSIGAAHVIDYTREDFTRPRDRYDVIVDIPGNRSIAACRRALTPKGTYVFIGHDRFGRGSGGVIGSMGRIARLLVMSPFVSQTLFPRIARTADPLAALTELIEAGELVPVIDRTFALEDVRAALRYLQDGRALGKIIITP